MGKKKIIKLRGDASRYISRRKAIRKLQVSLKDFRRLCILKGIYPREPTNKADGKDKTYYYRKDIKYLEREPVLEKFREQKTFTKKLKKAKGKEQWGRVEFLEKKFPRYTIDHLVKERYPSFSDALRDLDDALCLVHLFAALPQTSKVKKDRIANSRRLADEFQTFIMETQALRKAFLSVKGVYFQAEVRGETLTWLVPYNFPYTMTKSVDYRVMMTFLEFYEVLLRSVNHQLYHSLNLKYPPQMDEERFENGESLTALIVEEKKRGSSSTMDVEDVDDDDEEQDEEEEEKVGQNDEEQEDEQDNEEQDKDDFSHVMEQKGEGEVVQYIATNDKEEENAERFKNLFKGLKFFISREVPRDFLVFAIRCFGGSVSWDTIGGASSSSSSSSGDETTGSAPYPEWDETITHHVSDRPSMSKIYPSRDYIQPQWVFDCINFQFLIPTGEYGPGMKLPPHLSPFVDDETEGYVPKRKKQLLRMKKQLEGGEVEEETDSEDESDDEQPTGAGVLAPGMLTQNEDDQDDDDDVQDSDDEEDSEEDSESEEGSDDEEDAEQKELAEIMMSRKNRRLYSRIKYSENKKKEKAAELRRKRKLAEKEEQQEQEEEEELSLKKTNKKSGKKNGKAKKRKTSK